MSKSGSQAAALSLMAITLSCASWFWCIPKEQSSNQASVDKATDTILGVSGPVYRKLYNG